MFCFAPFPHPHVIASQASVLFFFFAFLFPLFFGSLRSLFQPSLLNFPFAARWEILLFVTFAPYSLANFSPLPPPSRRPFSLSPGRFQLTQNRASASPRPPRLRHSCPFHETNFRPRRIFFFDSSSPQLIHTPPQACWNLALDPKAASW